MAELDAAIMDGRTMKARAVAALRHIAHPISLARLVMEKTPHVLLVGEGAEKFAASEGIKPVQNSYLITPERRKKYVVAFSYPVVPKGKARIRVQLSAAHTPEDLEFAIARFAAVRAELPDG